LSKKHYIELAKNYIDKSMGVINDPKSFDYEKENSKFTWDISNRWLDLINNDGSLEADVESLLFNIYSNEISQTKGPIFISRLFLYVCIWAKEHNLLTQKSKEMMRELFTREASSLDEYYNDWMTDPPDKHVTLASSIVKRWINMINSNQITQENVDRIFDEIISYNTLAGSMFSGLAEEFRLWAEVEGFKVLSEKKLDKHFKKVSEDFVRKLIKENR